MGARRVLAQTVTLRDPKTLEIVILRPGDVPPAWARKLIRNPDLLVTESEYAGDSEAAGVGHGRDSEAEPEPESAGEEVETGDESSGPHTN